MKFTIGLVVFPISIHFWVGKFDAAKMEKFARGVDIVGEGGRLPDPDGDAACCYNRLGDSLIWLSRIPRTNIERGYLAHEIDHAVKNAGQFLGFRLSDDSSEFYAYINQYITVRALNNFKK